MEFKGTKDKYSSSKSTWGVYYERKIGEFGITGISVMPKGNQNGSQQIAICWDEKKIGRNGGLTIEEAEANAKLIASAPDLLEALQLAFKLELRNFDDRAEFLKKAKEAINKALN